MELIPGLIRNRELLQGQANLLPVKELQKFLTEHPGEITLDLTYDPDDLDSPLMWLLVDEDDDLVVPFQDFPFIIHILRANGTLAKAFKIIEEARLAEIAAARGLLLGAPREISVGVTDGLACGDEVKHELG